MRDFRDFMSNDWAGWTINFILGIEIDPPLERSRERDPRLRLIPLAQSLDVVSRLRFEEGLALALESTPPRQENARLLYYLFDLISYFTPASAKAVVRQLLFGGTLWRCHYRAEASLVEANLHTSALVACGAYSVDDKLADFMYRSLQQASDYRYYLACLRLLSKFKEQPATELLVSAIRAIRSQVDADKLARDLLKVSRRFGFFELTKWYKENASTMLAPPNLQWRLFSASWKMLMPQWDTAKSAGDPNEKLLALAVHPEKALVSAEDVLSIAGLTRVADIDIVAFALAVLMRRSSSRISYFDPRERLYSSMVRDPEKEPALIKVGRNGPATPIPSALRQVFEMSDHYKVN